MTAAQPHIEVFVLGDYQTNCHVVTPGSPAARQPCWIVDCGQEPRRLIQWIRDRSLEPKAIVLTHSHLDHIAGVDEALSEFGQLDVFIHQAEAGFCSNAMLNLSAMIGMDTTCSEPNRQMKDGDTLTLGDTRWRVLHTPGHSPGGACLVHDDSAHAIVGDTLFAGSIGRFDFPTSDPEALRRSLQLLMKLPDQMMIYPGHGPTTTIGEERRSNPYVRGGF